MPDHFFTYFIIAVVIFIGAVTLSMLISKNVDAPNLPEGGIIKNPGDMLHFFQSHYGREEGRVIYEWMMDGDRREGDTYTASDGVVWTFRGEGERW